MKHCNLIKKKKKTSPNTNLIQSTCSIHLRHSDPSRHFFILPFCQNNQFELSVTVLVIQERENVFTYLSSPVKGLYSSMWLDSVWKY